MLLYKMFHKNMNISSVSIVTRLWDGQPGFKACHGLGFFSPLCPDQLCSPPNLLSNGYWGTSPGVKWLQQEAYH